MPRAVCPGTFDPVTNGHVDIISRAATLFEEVIVAIGINKSKSGSRLFDAEERIEMLQECFAYLPNVTVAGFEGLLTDYCARHDIATIVKGLRGVTDFDYEIQMAQMNRHLTGVDTVFLTTGPEHSFLSSSLVKEVAAYGGDVAELVPPTVLPRLVDRLAQREVTP